MAIPRTSSHARSSSLPSTSHPLDATIEDLLCRLSASQAEPSSSSSSSLCRNLFSIKNLYEQMNDQIHLPHSQNVLSHESHRIEVEEVLDGSLTLLDVSNSAMDSLSQMKESILDLQSALRRGSDKEGIHAYSMSRKKICKTLSKCLADLKKGETSNRKESDAISVKLLKEAEVVSLSTLKSLLSFVMGKKIISKTRGWSLVSKLVKSKRMSEESVSQVEEIDCAAHAGMETKAFLKQLETLEMTIHEISDVLESFSRCLVKTRVSLLNVLNH